MPGLLIVGFIAFAIAIVIIGYIQAEKRKKELREWAQSNGLRFTPEKDYSMDARYGRFSCLQQGSRRYGFNIISGKWQSRPICAFDYHYETYSTDSKGRRTTNHHYFSAAVFDAGVPLKPLFIRTESFFDKIAEFVGFDDIDFELDEFSREFLVKSPDRQWAFDVLHQATMEFLLRSPRFVLDFQGRHVIAYRNTRFPPREFQAAAGVVSGIIDRFPEYLLRELKGID